MPKIFIDTQIYLNFYQSNVEISTVFKEINKIRRFLIIPEQVKDEFIRKRDTKIQELKKRITETYSEDKLSSFGIFRKHPEFAECIKLVNQINQIRQNMIKKCEEMLEDPKKDEIFSFFMDLYTDSTVQKLSRTEKIFQLALNRKFIGNPPISKDKITIGDEIIWESILESIKDDLIIISADNTFKNNYTFLFDEFQTKTDKKLLGVFKEISQAFKIINEIPSKDLAEYEKGQEELVANQIIKQIIHFKELQVATPVRWSTDSSGNLYSNGIPIINDPQFSVLSPSTQEKIVKLIFKSEEK